LAESGERRRAKTETKRQKKGEQRSENDDKTKLHLMREKYYLLFPIINLEHRAVRLTLAASLGSLSRFCPFRTQFLLVFLFNKGKTLRVYVLGNVSAIF
jgi:hypothetical protein